jgi:cytochrome c-type biogenesis protein CcmH
MRLSIPPHSPATPASKAVFLLSGIMLFAVLAIVQSGTIHAQVPDSNVPEGSYSESEAQSIDRMIMCPVCPAETIDQAQVQISQQMRTVVREMLAEGKKRDEILDFFVERYGQDILASPPKSGANLVAWLAPVAGVAAALVAVYFILRSMTRREPLLATPQPVQDVGLIPYLQLVDLHLGMTRSGARFSGTFNDADATVESSGTEKADPEGDA